MRKKIVFCSERDKEIFDIFLILIAGGLGAFGLEDVIDDLNFKLGLIKIGIAFLIILFVISIIRKKSDRKRAK